MMASPLAERLTHAASLARAAGAILLQYFDSAQWVVEHKADQEPVTIADREAEALIIAGLRDRYPADGILAEETSDKSSWIDHAWAWVIDPMDGTKDFIAGRDGFAVMIGLLHHCRPVLGVVYQPRTGRLYQAAQGHGAHLVDGQGASTALTPSGRKPPQPIRLVASKANRSPRIDAFKRSLGITDEIQRGSVGVKVGLIAAGERDLYLNPDGFCKLWDTCAPEAILREAGGNITDLLGKPLVYDNPHRLRLDAGIVASNGACHADVVRKLATMV